MTDTLIARRAVMKAMIATAAAGAFARSTSANILDGLGVTKLLGNASDTALDKLGETDGFYRDTAIRILLPGTKGKLARKLLSTGDKLGLTTKLTKSLNDAASLAAKEAKPVFRSAINGLKISDVPGLALNKDGGTQYLRKTAGLDLQAKVRPLVSAALSKVGAFDQLSKLSSRGALLGSLGLTNDKLIESVSDQAMNGIFSYIGSEEGKLRGNPGSLLKKVL